tara:strand:+ start:2299 stop:2739 length:441 start_codon:yes stop_codon:yes gene_type:complete
MTKSTPNFWEIKKLDEMSRDEWESLCDGCAKCCLHKIECVDSGDIYFTNVVCQYLDHDSCRCTVYNERHTKVPDCVEFDQRKAVDFEWLPETCAYRLLAKGQSLPDWHPLISGTTTSVHAKERTIKAWMVSELDVIDLEDHIIGKL